MTAASQRPAYADLPTVDILLTDAPRRVLPCGCTRDRDCAHVARLRDLTAPLAPGVTLTTEQRQQRARFTAELARHRRTVGPYATALALIEARQSADALERR